MRRQAGLKILGGLFIVFIAFLLVPSPIDPIGWSPPQAIDLAQQSIPKHFFSDTERLGINRLHAAEDIAVDAQGKIYATDEHRIIQLDKTGHTITTLVNTQGQNLGLDWLNPQTLVVANQPLGLLLVNTETKTVKTIPHPSVHYANAVAVSADQSAIYFTDSSDRFYGETWKYFYDLLEARPHGRLFAVNLKTGHFKLLLKNLYYPNGVALSPQHDYLLVNETYRYRIRRFWLKGPKAGTSDIFAENLPGFPDGLSRDPKTGRYWAAMYTIRNSAIDWLHSHPWLKAQLAKLPRTVWPKPKRYGLVLVFNAKGQIIDSFQDPKGTIFAVSSARRIGNQLYLGSLHGGFVGRMNLKSVQLSNGK